jgi:hypothetical protein
MHDVMTKIVEGDCVVDRFGTRLHGEGDLGVANAMSARAPEVGNNRAMRRYHTSAHQWYKETRPKCQH